MELWIILGVMLLTLIMHWRRKWLSCDIIRVGILITDPPDTALVC